MPQAPLKVLVSYDADFDTMTALELGEVIDGQFDDELVELSDTVSLILRDGRTIGFGVAAFSEFGTEEEPHFDADVRFDAPTLGVWNADITAVVFAAQTTIAGQSTPDAIFFALATEAAPPGEEGEEEPDDEGIDLDEAEYYWRACLATGDMKANFGLGYTLMDQERPRKAYGHLRTYTEVNPRNSWAWPWRGRAADEIGEPKEVPPAVTAARLSWRTKAASRLRRRSYWRRWSGTIVGRDLGIEGSPTTADLSTQSDPVVVTSAVLLGCRGRLGSQCASHTDYYDHPPQEAHLSTDDRIP